MIDTQELEALAIAYCRRYESERTAESEETFDVFDASADLVHRHKHPETALQFIVLALQQQPSEFAIANLAAGPLENLLAFHGHKIIDDVDLESRRNPAFNHLMGGVWLGRLDPAIAERVSRVRREIW